MIDIAVEL
jgi:hypothetical protein